MPAEFEALESAVAADPGGAQFPVLAEAYRRAGRHDDARRIAIAGLALRPDDTAGRLALGLTLLDLGEAAAARYELERAMGTVADHPAIAAVPSRDSDVTFDGGVGISSSSATNSSDEVSSSASDEVSARDFEAELVSEAGPEVLDAVSINDDELDAAFADAESVPDEMLDANRIAAQAMVDGELDEPEGFALEEAEAFEHGEESFQLGAAPAFATETMARLLADQGDSDGAEAIRERLTTQEPPGTPLALAPMDAAIVPDSNSIPLEEEMQPGDDAHEAESESRPGFAIADAAYAIDTDEARRGRIVARLETWLENLQRNHA